MNKFVRAAQTSHSLSLAAMEEASREGLRAADIEHMFLALVIDAQPAGHALRSLGIDLDSARRAVKEQHDAQLASLGIEASFPEAGGSCSTRLMDTSGALVLLTSLRSPAATETRVTLLQCSVN